MIHIARVIVIVAALTGCASKVGSYVTRPQTGRASLIRGAVTIPVTRDHVSEYEEKVFFIGEKRSRSEVDKTDHLGHIVVDVRSGACVFSPHGKPLPVPAAPATSAATASRWVGPMTLVTDHSYVTASNLSVFSSRGVVWVTRDGDTQPVAPNPDGKAAWLPDTDLVIANRKAIDVASGSSWDYEGDVVRIGDSIFMPRARAGILELSAATPHRQLAVHMPPMLMPGTSTTPWLESTPWLPGEKRFDATLIEAPEGMFLDGTTWRIYLGKNPGQIDLFPEQRLVVGDGIVVDLHSRVTTSVSGRARIARRPTYGWLLDTGGEIYEASDTFSWVKPFTLEDVAMVGFDALSFVVDSYRLHSILIFDATTRKWHAGAYKPCVPR